MSNRIKLIPAVVDYKGNIHYEGTKGKQSHKDLIFSLLNYGKINYESHVDEYGFVDVNDGYRYYTRRQAAKLLGKHSSSLAYTEDL